MNTLKELLPSLLSLVILLVFSSFFSGSETALFALTRSRVHRMRQGTNSEKAVHWLLANPQRLLSTLLVGNMLVNILLASVVATIMDRLVHSTGTLSILTAIVISTLLLMVFGELTPKTFAYQHAESVSVLAARPLVFLSRLLLPARLLLRWTSMLVLRLFGQKEIPSWGELTREELEATIAAAESTGVAGDHEQELAKKILDLDSIQAHEIMIHRMNTVAINDEMTVGEAFEKIRKLRRARLPVYSENIDDTWGIISCIHLLRWKNSPYWNRTLESFRQEVEDSEQTPELPILPVFLAPKTVSLHRLLNDMREKRTHFVVLLGEFGGTAGILTMNDILGELMIDLEGARKRQRRSYRKGDKIFVDGREAIKTLNREYNLQLSSSDGKSVGDYLIRHLGDQPPRANTLVTAEGYEFKITRMVGRRIGIVCIQPEAIEAGEVAE